MIFFCALLCTIFFSCCATAILSYLSMAIMLGPWIDSSILLCSALLFAFFARQYTAKIRHECIGLITAGAAIGGIAATAAGFAFPTLFFLDKELFLSWIATPLSFSACLAALVLVAGGFGILCADMLEKHFVDDQKLPFPVGQLLFKMLSAQNSLKKAYELSLGFILSSMYSAIHFFGTVLPRHAVLLHPLKVSFLSLPQLQLALAEFPLLWSIGFIAGKSIALPLLIGIVLKMVVCLPMHGHCFADISYSDFQLAFASGMVVYGAFLSFLALPGAFKDCTWTWIKKEKARSEPAFFVPAFSVQAVLWIVWGISTVTFLSWYQFGLVSQLYLIVFSALCLYQLCIIGGKAGIAPLARYATFVMMPGLFLFGYTAVQITLVSTFVEMCGGVAVDVLFGRTLTRHLSLDKRLVRIFQWVGLCACALSLGAIFLVLINKFGLGSPQLLAQRGQTRALLVGVQSFNVQAVILGALAGALLHDLGVNTIMVLGGILMNTDLALGLVAGGLSTYLVRVQEPYYPFCSGVFAASSLWMFLQAVL